MIVKKLYRKIKCNDWDSETKKFGIVILRDYIGYFLFGIIPIYMKMLNETYEFDDESRIQAGIYRQYSELLR